MLIERKDFDHEVRTVRGAPYTDLQTVYCDLNRLIICFLAMSTPAEILDVYHRAGYRGDPYSRGLHEAAKRYLALQRRAG